MGFQKEHIYRGQKACILEQLITELLTETTGKDLNKQIGK